MCKLSNSTVSRCCDPNNPLYDTVNEKIREAGSPIKVKELHKMANIWVTNYVMMVWAIVMMNTETLMLMMPVKYIVNKI